MKIFQAALVGFILIFHMEGINAETFPQGLDPEHLIRNKMDSKSIDPEKVSKLSEYPNFIYSKVMEDLLALGTFNDLSDQCSQHVRRVIVDLASSEEYALKSKLEILIIFHVRTLER